LALVSKPLAFAKTSPEPLRFDKKLGMCFGWSCFAKKDGEAYEDSHGDHIPEDDILLAALELSALPVEDRTIKANHSGGARGSIVSCWGMTEDIAKACDVDTHGTAGILVAFKPDEELLKSIESGEAFCLSIGGVSHDPEVIEKSKAAKVEKRKRVLRKVSIHEISVVKLGAHEGAKVALIKRADVGEPTVEVSAEAKVAHAVSLVKHAALVAGLVTPIEKRTPAATSYELGHQHLIYDADEKDGVTSYDRADGFQYGHSHNWIRGADGTLTVLAADGHTHTLATETIAMSNPTDIAKAQADITALKADFAKAKETFARPLDTLRNLPADQAAFAKRLKGDELEQFLGKPEADRAALAKPIHKSERTGRCYYAGEESLVEMAKELDSNAVELAKAREANETARIEKSAREVIPFVKGSDAVKVAIMRAVEALPEELRKEALETLRAANTAFESVTKRVGVAGGGVPETGALAHYNAGLAEFAKSRNAKPDDVALEYLTTDDGKARYAAYERELPGGPRN